MRIGETEANGFQLRQGGPMAGVSTDSGKAGGRKSVDQNVNMVPMIDLLISVIAFLLMTAVWVQTGALQAEQPKSNSSIETSTPSPHLIVMISSSGYRVGSSEADTQEIPNDLRRFESLHQAIVSRRDGAGAQPEVWIQPDTEVNYNEIVRVMDTVYDVFSAHRPVGQSASDLVTVRLL
jgi:biopolymer transport protein ExbD